MMRAKNFILFFTFVSLVFLQNRANAQAVVHIHTSIEMAEEAIMSLKEIIKHAQESLNSPDATKEMKEHFQETIRHTKEALKHTQEALRQAREGAKGQNVR